MTAHEAFNLALNDALTAHDRVIREEVSKAAALQKVRNAMDSLEQLFNAARFFYGAEPSVDASAAVCFMFGTHAFQDIVDKTSLQEVLTQASERDPRLMLNVQPNLTSIRDCTNLLGLNNM